MASPTTLQPQPLSTSSTMSRSMSGDEQMPKKPKKVNSEIRKQQNRIASKNYREKRKRKLQYLQHLIRDESSEQQVSTLSPGQREAYARSLSVGYESSVRSTSSYVLPASTALVSVGSSCATVSDPILIADGTTVAPHPLATSPPYPAFVHDWNFSLYSSPPRAAVSTFGRPFRASSTGFISRAHSHSEPLPYSKPSGAPIFATAQASVPQSYVYPSETDFQAWDSALQSQSQVSAFPSVSAPTSSSYHPPCFPPPY